MQPADVTDKSVTIHCAHGDSVSYPLARVKIELGGCQIAVEAAVAGRLPVPALLGWDIPEFIDLVNHQNQQAADVLIATDPHNDDESMEPALNSPDDPEPTDTHPVPMDVSPQTDSSNELIPADMDPEETETYLYNFNDSLFPSAGPSKRYLTRSQKRANNRSRTAKDSSPTTFPSTNRSISPLLSCRNYRKTITPSPTPDKLLTANPALPRALDSFAARVSCIVNTNLRERPTRMTQPTN